MSNYPSHYFALHCYASYPTTPSMSMFAINCLTIFLQFLFCLSFWLILFCSDLYIFLFCVFILIIIFVPKYLPWNLPIFWWLFASLIIFVNELLPRLLPLDGRHYPWILFSWLEKCLEMCDMIYLTCFSCLMPIVFMPFSCTLISTHTLLYWYSWSKYGCDFDLKLETIVMSLHCILFSLESLWLHLLLPRHWFFLLLDVCASIFQPTFATANLVLKITRPLHLIIIPSFLWTMFSMAMSCCIILFVILSFSHPTHLLSCLYSILFASDPV